MARHIASITTEQAYSVVYTAAEKVKREEIKAIKSS